MVLGLILVIIGAVFLLETLGIVAGSVWGFIWPIALIVVGISLCFKHKCKSGWGCSWCGCKSCKSWKDCKDCPECKVDKKEEEKM